MEGKDEQQLGLNFREIIRAGWRPKGQEFKPIQRGGSLQLRPTVPFKAAAPSCQVCWVFKRGQKFGCFLWNYPIFNFYFGNYLNKSSCVPVRYGLLFCNLCGREYQSFLSSQTHDIKSLWLLPAEGPTVTVVTMLPSNAAPPPAHPSASHRMTRNSASLVLCDGIQNSPSLQWVSFLADTVFSEMCSVRLRKLFPSS